MAQQYQTFEAFWPAYLAQRRRAEVRGLIYFGMGFAVLLVAKAIISAEPWWLLGALVSPFVYGIFGIAVFQREAPSLFRHPVWTLRGDLRLAGLFLTGKLFDEYRRLQLI